MEDSESGQSIEAWERYSESYDRILPHLGFYAEVLSRHVAGLLHTSVRRVIDIGAGTGNVAVRLIEQGVHVTAVDISAGMLNRFREKCAKLPGHLHEIVEADARTLERWPAESFDGANILLALFAMNDPGAALAEAIRVVRRGGRLMITEPKEAFRIDILLDAAERSLREQNLYEGLKSDWERVRDANRVVDPSRQHNRLPVEKIGRELRSAGFEILATQDSHLGQCATIWARKSGSAE